MSSSLPVPDACADHLERKIARGIKPGVVRDFPFDYEILVENLLDPSHVPFSHHGVIPFVTRSGGAPLNMTLSRSPMPKSIVSVEYKSSLSRPKTGRLTVQLEFIDASVVLFKYTDSQKEGDLALPLLFVCPVEKGVSRLLVEEMSSNAFHGQDEKLSFLQWCLQKFPVLVHLIRNQILDGDLVLLYQQGQRSQKDDKDGRPSNAYFTPASADTMVVHFRRWLNSEAGGGPFGKTRSEERRQLSREELLDRYKSHTAKCKVCQRALATIKGAVQVLGILTRACVLAGGILAIRALQRGVVDRSKTALCLAAFVVFSAFSHFLRKKIIPLFYFVDYVHAEKN